MVFRLSTSVFVNSCGSQILCFVLFQFDTVIITGLHIIVFRIPFQFNMDLGQVWLPNSHHQIFWDFIGFLYLAR